MRRFFSGFFENPHVSLHGSLCRYTMRVKPFFLNISVGRYVRYCPARWIELKVVSLERSLLNRGTGRFFLKTSATLSLMTTYRMSINSARSISMDRTFKDN
jgi:hypothetical protein